MEIEKKYKDAMQHQVLFFAWVIMPLVFLQLHLIETCRL